MRALGCRKRRGLIAEREIGADQAGERFNLFGDEKRASFRRRDLAALRLHDCDRVCEVRLSIAKLTLCESDLAKLGQSLSKFYRIGRQAFTDSQGASVIVARRAKIMRCQSHLTERRETVTDL